MTGSDRCREGVGELTEENFGDLFARYEHKIFNLVLRLVGDYEEAVDLTSETFVQALKGLPKFRHQAHPYTWLYRIAVNLCKNHFRRKSHRARFFAFSLNQSRDGSPDGEPPEIEDNSRAPETMLARSELQAEVEKAINGLPDDLRTAVVLRDMQGLSYKEMADILDCSLEAVKSRLFRARGILRKELAVYLSPADKNDQSEE